MGEAPNPETVGVVISLLARFDGEAYETEIFAAGCDAAGVESGDLRETLVWLEVASVAEQIGPERWRITPDLSSGLPATVAPISPEAISANLTEIAAWGEATLGVQGAAQALVGAAAEPVDIPTAVVNALAGVDRVHGGERSASYRLDVAFDALETRLPRAFDIYRRHKLTDDKTVTLQTLAEEYDMTRERVRQVESQFNGLLESDVSGNRDSPLRLASLRLARQLGPRSSCSSRPRTSAHLASSARRALPADGSLAGPRRVRAGSRRSPHACHRHDRLSDGRRGRIGVSRDRDAGGRYSRVAR
jgi:hypothetical protein